MSIYHLYNRKRYPLTEKKMIIGRTVTEKANYQFNDAERERKITDVVDKRISWHDIDVGIRN